MAERFQQFLGTKPGVFVELVDNSGSPYLVRTSDGFQFAISAEDFQNYFRREDEPTPNRWSHLITDPESGMVESGRISLVMDFVKSFDHAFPDFDAARTFLRDAVAALLEEPDMGVVELRNRLAARARIPANLTEDDYRRVVALDDDLKTLLLSESVAVIKWPALGGENGPTIEIVGPVPESDRKAEPTKKAAPRVRRAGMKNVEMTVDDDQLVITIDLTKDFGPSKSGKTTIVASTEGNKSLPGREEKIGLNVYRQEGKKPGKGRKTSFKNVTMEVVGEVLTIRVNLSEELGPSKSGKTVIVGSTGGNQLVPGREEKIGLNVYRSIE